MSEVDQPGARAIEVICSAPADQPFVVAQLGQSLDGRIATPTGESRWINGTAALDHVHRIRAAVDAVVVGIGTALADDPLLNVRRVPGRHPARVVIDPSGRLPATAKCLDGADDVRRIVVRATENPPPPPTERVREGSNTGVEVITLPRLAGQIPPRAIVEALFERGLKKLLIEGGATTVSAFIDAGVVDRLHVLVAPMILGSGKMGLCLEPICTLGQALRPNADVHILADGDVLFECELRDPCRGS